MKTDNKTEQLQVLELASIVTNDFNPRKTFNDEELAELAESIKAKGVIQPIRVRPVEERKYEIICGERRYKASLLAGQTTIPAIVCNYSDKEAKEIAVVENLQREDVLPLEEAEAYNKLMQTGDYTVQDLAKITGKSERYVQIRLKLTELVDDVKQMLKAGEISLPFAVELCKYNREIQEQVFKDHLNTESWKDWKALRPAQLARNINQFYTNQLDLYHFDKTACQACFMNSKNQILFDEGAQMCTNRKCLAAKNTNYILSKVKSMLLKYPEAVLCAQDPDAETIRNLEKKGYEIKKLDYLYDFPGEEPKAPQEGDFKDKKEYQEALKKHRNALNAYSESVRKVKQLTDSNSLKKCLCVTANDVVLMYTIVTKGKSKPAKSPAELIQFLEDKDERNNEIKGEKIIQDVKELAQKIEYSGAFTKDEEMIFYYYLLSTVQPRHFKAIGAKDAHVILTEEQKLSIIANLTSDIKNLIIRDYICSHFHEIYKMKYAEADFLMKFTRQHNPRQVAEVEKTHTDEYMKKKERLDERKVVAEALLRREKAKEKAKKTQMQIIA